MVDSVVISGLIGAFGAILGAFVALLGVWVNACITKKSVLLQK